MSGMVEVRSGRKFLFRFHDGVWLLWDTESDISRGRCDRMQELPPGNVVMFDIDDPPASVSFQPVLGVLG